MQLWSTLLLGGIVLSSCQGQDSQTGIQAEAVVREAAPPIPIYDSFDQIASLFNKQNDTTYLINFWATWCKPCVEEMPYIERLHEDFAGKKLSVVLVSLDFPDQIESKLIPFVQQRQLRSSVIALTDGNYNAWIDRVDPAWGGAIPVTLIYNAEKRVFIDRQFSDYEALKSVVDSFF
ncbi:MAG: TlpA family protein disulfide reductase [Saprospirales bacterium]|nr:TlpA family protein disulfide reductase [Saprospirales bacterium]